MSKEHGKKHYQSPRWSGEYLDCSMPMTFDTYNKCSYDCLYCFSFFQKSVNALTHAPKGTKVIDYQNSPLTWVDVESIKRMFRQEKNSQFSDYIKERRVMQWGGLADQFDPSERKEGITLELMRFFDEIDYPLSFSTKAVWFTKDDRYMDLIKKHAHNWHFKISIINLDAKKARAMEKKCPSPLARIAAIKTLADAGLHVTLRLRPFIIGFTNANDEHLELIRLAAAAGADSISTEFFCLEGRASPWLKDRYKQMSKIMGFDILKFYKSHSKGAGYHRLNYDIKTPYVKQMREACDKAGVKMFVSDAHHKEKCEGGSCCGLPCSMNYSRGQFTEALVIAKEKGEVRFSDIALHVEIFKKVIWRNATGLNTKNNQARVEADTLTLYDTMRNKWNNPKDHNSPYKYFAGVLVPDRLDENEDIVYRYDYDKAAL